MDFATKRLLYVLGLKGNWQGIVSAHPLLAVSHFLSVLISPYFLFWVTSISTKPTWTHLLSVSCDRNSALWLAKKAYVFGSWSSSSWKLALWLAVLLTELWTTKHIFLKEQRRWHDRVAKIVLSLASTLTNFSEVKELRFLANKLSFILIVVYVSTKQLGLSLCKKIVPYLLGKQVFTARLTLIECFHSCHQHLCKLIY